MTDEQQQKKNTRLLIIIVIVVVLAGGAWWLLGRTAKHVTENSVENAIEDALSDANVNADIDIGDQTLTVTTDDGSSSITVGQDDLPDTFDSDLPVYDNATVQATATVAESNGANVSWLTTDSASDVTDYYSSALVDEGWTIDATVTIGDATSYTFSKDSRQGTVSISPGDDGTMIVMTVFDATE